MTTAIRQNNPEPTRPQVATHNDGLGFTCLKWSASGELSELDRQLVLERLARFEADRQEPPPATT